MQANLLQNLFNPTVQKASPVAAGKNAIPAGQSGDEFASLLNISNNTSKNVSSSVEQDPMGQLLNLIESSPELSQLVQQLVMGETGKSNNTSIDSIVSKQMMRNAPEGVNPQMSAILNVDEKTTQKLLEAFKGNNQLVQLLKSSPNLANELNLQVVEKNPSENNPFQMITKKQVVELKDGTTPGQLKSKIVELVVKQDANGQKIATANIQKQIVSEPVISQSFGQQKVNRTITSAYGQQQKNTDNNIIKFDRSRSTGPSSKEIFTTTETGEVVPMFTEQHIVPQVGQANLSTNAPQVLDLSGIQVNDTTELIAKISDYIKQTQFQNSDSLELIVKHNDLGQFKINVEKVQGSDQLNLQIASMNKEGQEFFKSNELNLVKSLASAGVNLGDLKLLADTSKSNNNSRNFTGQQGQNSSSQEFGSSDQSQQQRDSHRRQKMWEEYSERFVA